MSKLKELASLLLERFLGRRDAYAVQLKDGSYRARKKPLTHEVVERHLAGKTTVGTYVPNEQGLTPFIVWDFDSLTEPTKRAIEVLAKVLTELGFHTLVEFSGRRGFHLWLLFDKPLDAKRAIQLARAALSLAAERLGAEIACEVFPKAAKPPKLGNVMKLPWGKHRLGERSRFLNERWEPYEDQLEVLRAVKVATMAEVEKALEMLQRDEPTTADHTPAAPSAVYREPLPCFHEMMKGVEEGCRDKVGFALAKHLRRQGKSREEAETLLLDWNAKNRPPLPPNQVLQKVAQAYEKGYRSLDCQDECVQQFCQAGCPLALAARRIEWRFWSSGELGRAEIEPVRMIVGGVSLPEGGSLLLAGPPGVGKSWVALDLGICLASGSPFLETYDALQRNVLFFDEEGGESGTKERHDALKRAHGLDPGDDIPLWIAIKTGLRLDRQDDIGRLIQTIQQYEAQVVIFDSLIRLHGGDENSSRDMGLLSRNLNRVQAETGVALVLIQHTRKQLPGGSRRDIVRGSSEITAWPDVIVSCECQFGVHTFHCIKSRYREEFADICWTLDVGEQVVRLRIEDIGLTTYEQARKASAKRIVLKVAEDGEWHARQEYIDRAKAVGIGKPTCTAVLRELVQEGLLEFREEGPQRRHLYRLKRPAVSSDCSQPGRG